MGVVFWSLLSRVWEQSGAQFEPSTVQFLTIERVKATQMCRLRRSRRRIAAGEVMGGLVWQGVEGRRESVLSERFFLRRWQVREGVPADQTMFISIIVQSSSLSSSS